MTHDDENKHKHWYEQIEFSALLSIVGILFLFSISIAIILITPRHIDPSWTSPTTPYQVMMYEIADPNMYISGARKGTDVLEFVQHLKAGFSLLAFKEDEILHIIAPPELEEYVTTYKDKTLKLTTRLLLLREPLENTAGFNAYETANKKRKQLQEEWEKEHPDWKEKALQKIGYHIMELYVPAGNEIFALANSEGDLQEWVDANFTILEGTEGHNYHKYPGVIYIKNPKEYRVSYSKFGPTLGWHYDPLGKPVSGLEQLKGAELGFMSRKELIDLGEDIFKIEGCWYCHTDQTRTLVQDVVANGSESFPAPPSSPNEYIYQRTTFMGTRRIGPDLSRVGVKRPSRDWNASHFWYPKTTTPGTIMPQMRHFFDNDPRGTGKNPYGVPNYKFEAIYQYLMTKGTRITPPTQAWWLGKDPIRVKEIIEGQRVLEN